MVFRHLVHAYCQGTRDNSGQRFRNCRHSKSYREHHHFDDKRKINGTTAIQLPCNTEARHKKTYNQRGNTKPFSYLGSPFLKGRLF